MLTGRNLCCAAPSFKKEACLGSKIRYALKLQRRKTRADAIQTAHFDLAANRERNSK